MKDSSRSSAARFIALREKAQKRERRRMRRWKPPCPDVAPSFDPDHGRIFLDFARPTLEVIHRSLLYRLETVIQPAEDLHGLLIAERMVARALGEPELDHPPLTDRVGGS